MQKYRVKMKNPLTGKIEVYTTRTDNPRDIEASLDIFREGGYEIVVVEPAGE